MAQTDTGRKTSRHTEQTGSCPRPAAVLAGLPARGLPLLLQPVSCLQKCLPVSVGWRWHSGPRHSASHVPCRKRHGGPRKQLRAHRPPLPSCLEEQRGHLERWAPMSEKRLAGPGPGHSCASSRASARRPAPPQQGWCAAYAWFRGPDVGAVQAQASPGLSDPESRGVQAQVWRQSQDTGRGGPAPDFGGGTLGPVFGDATSAPRSCCGPRRKQPEQVVAAHLGSWSLRRCARPSASLRRSHLSPDSRGGGRVALQLQGKNWGLARFANSPLGFTYPRAECPRRFL